MAKAALLQATNLLAEVIPVYRRGLGILIGLMPQGYQRQILKAAIGNYISFLQVQGLSKEAVQAKIGSLYQHD